MTIATNALLEALLQQNGDAREIGKIKLTLKIKCPRVEFQKSIIILTFFLLFFRPWLI